MTAQKPGPTTPTPRATSNATFTPACTNAQVGATAGTPAYVTLTPPLGTSGKSNSIDTLLLVALVGAAAAQILSHRFTKARERRKERTDAFDRLLRALITGRQALAQLGDAQTDDDHRTARLAIEDRWIDIQAARASYRSRFGTEDEVLTALDKPLKDLSYAMERTRAVVDEDGKPDVEPEFVRVMSSADALLIRLDLEQASNKATLLLMGPRDRKRTTRAAAKDRERLERFIQDIDGSE